VRDALAAHATVREMLGEARPTGEAAGGRLAELA
jgi:hypothetical protein